MRPRIRLGGFGVLDVYVDGRLIFSKSREGALLDTDEIVRRIQALGP